MCEKCVRKAKRLGHKPLTYGQVKALSYMEDTPVFFIYDLPIYRDVPLFINPGINYAIEAHKHKVKRKKTNKKIYNRKGRGGEVV